MPCSTKFPIKDTTPVKASEIRNGMAVNMDGQLWLVIGQEHVKPGKGPAYNQVKLKSVATGANQEKRLRSSEEVEQAILDKREMEYLYSDNTGAVFMDSETFEQVTMPSDILGDALSYIKENTACTVLVHEGNPVSLDLPQVVDLVVSDTPPGIKDATKTNQLKEATLETGLKTRVPPFIKNGETVRVSTETGEYMSRVND